MPMNVLYFNIGLLYFRLTTLPNHSMPINVLYFNIGLTTLHNHSVPINVLYFNIELLYFRSRSTFSFTRQASALLERVAMAVKENEPVLLVGETGTGKTSSVQFLAQQLGKEI